MGCQLTESRGRICKSLQGGLNRVYIFPFVKYTKSQIIRDGMTVVTFPSTEIFEFEVLSGANLTQTQDNQDGLKSYKQTLEIKLAQNQGQYELERLLKKDVRIIVEDKNGKFRLLGAYNGAECTGIEYSTGGGYSDLNGMTISFEATEIEEALYIDLVPNSDFTEGDFLLLETGLYLLLETSDRIELESLNYSQMETILLNESFASLPAGWTNNGFTVNSGLEISGAGGMGSNIVYNSDSYLDRQIVRVEFLVNDLTSAFAVSKNEGLRGDILKADFDNDTLELGIIITAGVEPTYAFSTAISNVTKTLGATYILELRRDRQIITGKLYEKNTPNVYDEIVRDYDVSTTFAGSFWGEPEAIFFNGDIKITNFKYIAISPAAPKIAMYGDSITEGYNNIVLAGNLKGRWSDKLWVSNNGNAYISAKGGATTATINNYIDFEFDYLSPTYTIILLGTNDVAYATWKANMDSIIAKVLANGSTPVLATLPPRVSNQAFLNDANNQIMNTYSLSYDYIDFAAAVTVGRDRLTWVASYLLGDGVHPTVLGMLAMYEEIIDNNSYLI